MMLTSIVQIILITMIYFCRQANVALNLNAKQNETKPDQSSNVNNESNEDSDKQERVQKVRKVDIDGGKPTSFSSLLQEEIEKKKNELAELEQKSNDVTSEGTIEEATTSSGHVANKPVESENVNKIILEK